MNSLMKLTTYSESETETEDEVEEKNESRLPLPNFLAKSQKQTLQSRQENSDGKVRNFPHEPGNWATFIYLPLDPSQFLGHITALMTHFKPLNLKPVDDFHISLTRTVILRHHWIPDFTKTVQKSLAEVRPFKIHLYGLKAYTNEQKTRSFLSLKVDQGEEDLKRMVSGLDNCLRDYSLQSFYDNPSFHVSLLWCSGDRCSEINTYKETLPIKLKSFDFSECISYCVCASGNKRFSFYFHN